ncbi:MAG TPA: zinc ribbon domain-containing protein, partial [Gemmataceae bacterium]|nr:zinc ribbon domain-containing protein [Gemmataceae bacterium]
MPQTCPACSRINPAEALFCFQDGTPLRALAGRAERLDPGSRPFPAPFVFPSGVACQTFDQLALGCVNDWSAAVELLRQGYFAGFLGGLGRAALAQAAKEAARYPDPDRGLDQFLAKLPARSLTPASLTVEPRKINLGQLTAGVDRKIELHLGNQGMGLLFGSVTCEETSWLAVGEGHGVASKMLQFLSDTVLPVQVRGQHLRAGNKPLQGRITIQSNGGTEVVVVTADVPIVAFPDGVLAGAKSPRQIAEKAKANPKEAAALFEKGRVAAWYKSNGWDYPVLGDSASGVAAVQQFFEALGLTAPPKVEISDQALTIFCKPGESLRHTLTVSTPEKRPVYARAVSDKAWLKIAGIKMEGRTATIQLTVPSVPDVPGETIEALVTVTSNGNQRFEVPVTLSVSGTRKRGTIPVLELGPATNDVPLLELATAAATAPAAQSGRNSRVAPVASVVEPVDELPVLDAEIMPARRPPPRPAPVAYDVPEDRDWEPRRRRRESRWKHAIPIFFIAIGLLTALVRDIIVFSNRPNSKDEPDLGNLGGDEFAVSSGTIEVRFHDTELIGMLGKTGMKPAVGASDPTAVKVFWEPSMRFGLVMREDKTGGEMKRLTFKENGVTNNTCIRLDGRELLFGEKPFRTETGERRPPEDWPGRWLERDGRLGEGREGRRSVWYYDTEQVKVTQTVEVVHGPQTSRPDTCLVRYRIENGDQRGHRIGLRFLLDTYIGSNDGVPFLIPGKRELCNTQLEFRPPMQIPDFIQALEKEDLTNPGTVAQIQLKLGAGVEPPTSVTLGSYPNPRLAQMLGDNRCRQEKTMWDVPVYSIKTLDNGDSAVTLYWEERELGPGQVREVGFSYGLGSVAGKQGKGKLALTVGGSFTGGEEFTATAYV